MTTNEPEFKMGDTVRPKDLRNERPEFTFTLESDEQFLWHERLGTFLYLTGTQGVGFLAEELELVSEKPDTLEQQ